MAIVYVTQVPHRNDPHTKTFTPTVNISPAMEHGRIVVLMPPRASFLTTHELLQQLRAQLATYSIQNGDCLLALGDPIISASAIAILAVKGAFTVLRWDKNLGRYAAAQIVP